MIHDFIIIGGGILGSSTAWQLKQRYPGKKILILEKETEFACHQTGRNSGVIHAGVYYEPGSFKAKFCQQGLVEMVEFCRTEGIPYEQCGKLLVATDASELQRMQGLFQRCLDNGIDAEMISQQELRAREPGVRGLGAIFVRPSGIVDFKEVCMKILKRFSDEGGEFLLNTAVHDIQENDESVTVNTKTGRLVCRHLICCAGLMADRLARLHGLPIDFRIIPFRGEYYRLAKDKNGLVNHLIYPIPDPGLPFLGVHLTRMIDGSITVGPNALLGWKREGYGKLNLSMKDAADTLSFPGFWKLIAGNVISGVNEFKNSVWKPGYLKEVQKYCPQLQGDDLLPHPTGVRAQAVYSNGDLAQDFHFIESPRSLHVCHAPSPAATSAFPIGGYICDKIQERI